MRIFRLIRHALLAAVGIGAVVSLASARDSWAGIECNPNRQVCGKLFVIAVGVDLPSAIVGGARFESQFAESDARLITARLSHGHSTRAKIDSLARAGAVSEDQKLRTATAALQNPADTISNVQAALLVGQQATKEAVAHAFEAVIRKARPNDTFVFSFGGFSRTVKDSLGEEHYLAVGGLPNFGNDSQLRQRGISGPQMRQWLDNIAATNQLLIVEAGDMRQFMPEFVASLIENRPTAAQLTNRERVVVAPREYGIEIPTAKAGPIAHAISTSQRSVLDLFYAPARPYAEMDLRQLTNELAKFTWRDEYLRVFYEKDFLQLYSRVAEKPVALRGLGDAATAEPARQQGSPTGRHTALLIGTDRYDARQQWSPLANPVNDVRTIAAELANNFGFDTTVLANPTLDEMLAALVALKAKNYGPNDELFIFVAGHGLYSEKMGAGYLVARDSRSTAEDPFLRSYLGHRQLEDIIPGIPAEHALLVLDACFGGSFTGPLTTAGSRNEEYGDVDRNTLITRKLEHKSRLYLTSGGKEYVPDGRPNAHSPFARRLLDALRNARAENRVLTMATLRSQIEGLRPEPRSGDFGDSEPGGDFLFVPVSR